MDGGCRITRNGSTDSMGTKDSMDTKDSRDTKDGRDRRTIEGEGKHTKYKGKENTGRTRSSREAVFTRTRTTEKNVQGDTEASRRRAPVPRREEDQKSGAESGSERVEITVGVPGRARLAMADCFEIRVVK